MKNVLKSATTAEGGRGAIKFSAEKMVNSATWRIVECIRLLHGKRELVSHRADFFCRFLHENQ